MKFLSFLCTKLMENCEAMTSSSHSFAYSYQLVKRCFLKICETSKCHNFLIVQLIFIKFSLFCLNFFSLSSDIKLNLFRISPLKGLVFSTILQSQKINWRILCVFCMYSMHFSTLQNILHPFHNSLTYSSILTSNIRKQYKSLWNYNYLN